MEQRGWLGARPADMALSQCYPDSAVGSATAVAVALPNYYVATERASTQALIVYLCKILRDTSICDTNRRIETSNAREALDVICLSSQCALVRFTLKDSVNENLTFNENFT